MRGTTPGLRRLLLVAALACSAVLTTIEPAAAYTPPFEVYSGQHAHYYVRDDNGSPKVTCNYGSTRLKQIVVKIPYVWWFDTTSSSNSEHGKVGWQVRIQTASDPNGTWTTKYTSSTEKQTAYEDHPGYDANDRAHFSKRTINWSTTADVVVRVKLIMSWYNSSGSTKGTVTHWYEFYHGSFGSDLDGYCNNYLGT